MALSIHGESGGFRVILFKRTYLQIYQKHFRGHEDHVTHKEYKHTGGKRQEYFAVNREYAGRHKIELILAIFDDDTKNKSAC
jgi:hypothetical protein